MITASRLAGYFAAHAVWCMAGNGGLTPMLAYTRDENERKMERLLLNDAQSSVALGRSRLESNDMDADDAVLVYDGRLKPEDGGQDAIIIEMRAYFSPDSGAIIAILYTPGASGEFRLHRTKLLQWHECEDFDIDAALEAFLEGSAEHKEGASVWRQHRDAQSDA